MTDKPEKARVSKVLTGPIGLRMADRYSYRVMFGEDMLASFPRPKRANDFRDGFNTALSYLERR